jgi:glycosyltransferase involved in cell wall biosynthesis
MKKIVFIHLLNDFSGSPKVLSQVIQAHQANGGDLILYTGKSKSGFLSHLIEDHRFFFYKRFENRYLTLVSYLLSQLILFFKLLSFARQDVLIYVNTMLPFGAALAGKLMGKPVYYHVHEISLRPAGLKRFLRFIVQKTASKVIFVSKAVQKEESFVPMQQKVVYNCLSDSFVQVAEQADSQPNIESRFTVLMICSLKAYKGVNEFVEVARRCLDEDRIAFHLVLNADQSEIDAYFTGVVLPDNIKLFPRQKNVLPFYKEANLVLNLSRVDEWVETFGLTIIEAMAFGIPVIVPPVGGPAEIVREGREGYQISAYEIETLVETIRSLSMDEKEQERLSKNARKRSLDFKEDKFREDILKVVYE